MNVRTTGAEHGSGCTFTRSDIQHGTDGTFNDSIEIAEKAQKSKVARADLHPRHFPSDG